MLTCPACGRTSPAEASFCAGCGTALGATASTREVRKTVSALFCDLVGSTRLGETHDPEVLRPLLHAYFAEMRGAVERHGGRVEKFIGDAVSAVFGLPVAHEDDALRAVRAAVEMQERLVVLNEGSAIRLACRIGVTTGEVLVPAGGEPLIGDAMNTAARLQATAEPGAVLIGEPTWRLVRDAVVAQPVEPLLLKGKAIPVSAYRVVRVASLSPMRTRRLDAPMVGRARESILLDGAYERAASDRACQLFTVLGPAGAGKSRLVEEFLAKLAVAGDGEVIRGGCLPYGDGITWYPVTEALREALGLPDFADAAEIREAIQAAVGAEEHAASLKANLARLFAAGQEGSPEETFWAIRRFLESRGREHPLVLVLDDIHWGEPTFLDFVEHVADWSRDAAILVLCMARPELLDVRPAWGGGKTNATTISLAPLTDAECDQLIEGLLGSSALPNAVRSQITTVAEGNPLFVEEVLRMLVDDGRLVRDKASREWITSGDLVDIHVPPTISALLSARLDRLSDDERLILGAASVEGKEFHRGAVMALLGESATPDLDAQLRSLTRKELIAPQRSSLPGEDAYRFRHLLIRDTAYDAIPKTERAELHRAFADWLEAVAGDRVVEQEEIVGHHLERAHAYRIELGLAEDRDLRLRAAKRLGSAGARALDAGDAGAAVALLRPASELAGDDPVQLETLARLVMALHDLAEEDESGTVLDRLAAAATDAGDAVFTAWARAVTFMRRQIFNPEGYEPEAHRETFEAALATYREHGATQFVPGAINMLADLEWCRGHMIRMRELASDALDAALAVDDRRTVRLCVSYVLSALQYGPEPLGWALERTDQYLERLSDDRALRAVLLSSRACSNAWLGRGDEARVDGAASRVIAEELGQRWLLRDYPLIDGWIAWLNGDLAEAEARLAEGIEISTTQGDRVLVGFYGPVIARVMLDRGRDASAEKILLDFRDHRSVPTARANSCSIGAVVAARRGEISRACQLAEEAEVMVEPTQCLIDQADVALDRAEVLLLAGRPDEARASAEDGLGRFERKEYAIGIRRSREFLAALPG